MCLICDTSFAIQVDLLFKFRGVDRQMEEKRIMKSKDDAVYIATLGFAPQVVTLGLFAVQNRFPDQKIEKVVVIHTSLSIPKNAEAVETLRNAFHQNEFLSDYPLEFKEILVDGKPIVDIKTTAEVEATLRTIFETIRDAKLQNKSVHLNVSGGRKTMSIFAVVAAQLLFDDGDHAWHLISDLDFMNTRALLPEKPDQIQLVPIPIIPWSDVAPILTGLASPPPSLLSEEFYRKLYERRRQRALEIFVMNELTRNERKVLWEVVLHGGSNREIAKRLKKSPRTVEHQLQSIYRKFKRSFGVSLQGKLRRELLVREFSPIVAKMRAR